MVSTDLFSNPFLEDLERLGRLLNLSQLYAVKGDFAAAIMSNNESIEILKNNFGSTSTKVASGICAFAALLDDIGEVDSAIYYNEMAIEILQKLPSEKLLLSIALGNLGNCYNTLSRWKDANICFSESLKIKSEIGDTTQNYAILLMNQGLLLINIEQPIISLYQFSFTKVFIIKVLRLDAKV